MSNLSNKQYQTPTTLSHNQNVTNQPNNSDNRYHAPLTESQPLLPQV